MAPKRTNCNAKTDLLTASEQDDDRKRRITNPYWRSPESWVEMPWGPPADIWSFGAIVRNSRTFPVSLRELTRPDRLPPDGAWREAVPTHGRSCGWDTGRERSRIFTLDLDDPSLPEVVSRTRTEDLAERDFEIRAETGAHWSADHAVFHRRSFRGSGSRLGFCQIRARGRSRPETDCRRASPALVAQVMRKEHVCG